MTHEELIKEIRRLPLAKRKVLLEAIVRSVQDEAPELELSEEGTEPIEDGVDVYDNLTLSEAQQIAGMWTRKKTNQSATHPHSADQQAFASVNERLAAVQRLFGILKRDGEAPAEEELKEEYANYLAEKYS
jgi:hypothetical protein